MGGKGLVALGAATIALLAGPGTAWAQEDGTASDSTPAAADPPVATQQEPATTTESDGTTTTPADETGAAESTPPATEESSTESTPPATEESSTESTDAPVPEPEAANSANTEATQSTEAQVEDQPQAQLETASSVTKELGATATAKKSGGKVISCATKAQGPPPPGCTRIDGGQVNGVHPVVINGVTITFTFTIVNTPQGPTIHWTSDVPFTGTIFVKGGPDSPGFPCTYVNATADASGNCHAPLNPKNPNNKFYGVSHITLCPAGVTPPPPPPGPGPGPGPGPNAPGGAGPGAGVGGKEQGGERGVGARGTSPAVASAAAAAAAAAGEQLPFTGLNFLWLVLMGGALLSGGTILRARRS